ncbi:hypothetical protein D3C72_1878130 [compost metagenome]
MYRHGRHHRDDPLKRITGVGLLPQPRPTVMGPPASNVTFASHVPSDFTSMSLRNGGVCPLIDSSTLPGYCPVPENSDTRAGLPFCAGTVISGFGTRTFTVFTVVGAEMLLLS